MVESADNGILFLDEIHRLNPEGQEKLFLLLDQGVFQRMGEPQKDRRVHLRLIGATTESPPGVYAQHISATDSGSCSASGFGKEAGTGENYFDPVFPVERGQPAPAAYLPE